MKAAELELIHSFVNYAATLKGDEKGEAQVFCDRLFQAFGHAGYKEAGAELEFRVVGTGGRTKFVDLLWRPRLLIEMKKRGEKLQRHYSQAFEYWLELVPNRPKYVILCNFDEFWIYDFDLQLNDPVDVIAIKDMPSRYTAFNFLFPIEKKPQFGNNRVDVTRSAADKTARVFNLMVARGESRERAQLFILQCVVSMFAEDADLLPRGLFSELLDECRMGSSSYDLIGGLFRQMNNPLDARGGRFKSVRYFNGGVFKKIEPVEMALDEIKLLLSASEENWSKVQPPIFGTLFQSSMDQAERHALGAHFTSEADIQKVVLPTIVRPWRGRIESAKTLKELRDLLEKLRDFRVLDPACGSGNFLYIAYLELKRLELSLLAKIHGEYGKRARREVGMRSMISTKQIFGIDVGEFAVELAKVTLMLAKELAIDESRAWLDEAQLDLPIEFDAPLPLDTLDDNFTCDDALFCKWPSVHAIVGNPPYQSKNKMQREYGPAYLNRLRDRYPEVPGRADYCVYWFRRAHDELPKDGRAGLVGTNTIRQNYSREGGLDYIVANGGTITEAVSTQVWSGEAAVHVSIVNWLKGKEEGKKKLFTQLGDHRESPWEVVELENIGPALSALRDVTQARRLRVNIESDACYQGQTHGHEGFLLSEDEVDPFMRDQSLKNVLHPFMTGEDLLSKGKPTRYAIDLNECDDILEAMKYGNAYLRLQKIVMPAMRENAEKERNSNEKPSGPRRSHYHKWWKFWRGRPELIDRLVMIHRYIACARVTKRPIFEFIDAKIRPNDSLQVFTLNDDYSFGILQSRFHWSWFQARCSTLKRDFRYTSDSVFDTFPWPQSPGLSQAKKVAESAAALRILRRKIMIEYGLSLRDLYRKMEIPGNNPLRTAHETLDTAVRSAYGIKSRTDPLDFLLNLNADLADREASMKPVVGPGLPPVVENTAEFITKDCISMRLDQ